MVNIGQGIRQELASTQVITRNKQNSEAQESASKAGVGKHLLIKKHRARKQESTTNLEQAEYVSSTTSKECLP